MSVKSVMRGMLTAAMATIALATALPADAQAQGLFEGFWGGEEKWGGKRQSVPFGQQYTPGQIIVSFGDRRLYHVVKPGTAISYPIAVPREKSRWSGVTSVSMKRENPDWTPTPEMFRENPRLPPWVPGGHPMNPLGNRALYLGASTYRIHGTDAPWTIGQAVSKGCIRMFNEDVQALYPQVKVGTKVTVTWQRFNGQGGIAGTDQPPPPDATETASAQQPSRDENVTPRYYKKTKAYRGGYSNGYKPNTSDSASDDEPDSTAYDDQPYGGDARPSKKTKVVDASDVVKPSRASSRSDDEPKYSTGPRRRYIASSKKSAPTSKSANLDQ
jgi:lipoprotein-anchoring transpeptidase ErfK/SrfK